MDGEGGVGLPEDRVGVDQDTGQVEGRLILDTPRTETIVQIILGCALVLAGGTHSQEEENDDLENHVDIVAGVINTVVYEYKAVFYDNQY